MSHSTPINQLPRNDDVDDAETSNLVNNILAEIEQSEHMQQPGSQMPPFSGGYPPQPPMREGLEMPPMQPGYYQNQMGPPQHQQQSQQVMQPPEPLKKDWSKLMMEHGKEPFLIFVLVFLIQMKFATKMIGQYIPKSFNFDSGSMTWFGVAMKALLVALIVFLVKFLKLI